MANFVGPYFVRINYHSVNGLHTMTIPTLTWNPGAGSGTFDVWVGAPRDAVEMVEALVTTFLPLFDPGVTFDNWTVFKQLLDTDFPQPQVSNAFTGMTGTEGSASWGAAVEKQFILKTEAFGIAKIVLLDAASFNDFSPILIPAGDDIAVIAEWTANGNGWRGRDNSRPATFLKITLNLNQKLRKEYRLD